MTSKGPSSVHLVSAESAPGSTATRRGLIAMAGATALSGAAAALLSNGRVGAAPPAPTESDKLILNQVLGLELAARDLYGIALDTVRSDLTELVGVLRANHGTYAETIAGATGISANRPNNDVIEANAEAFGSPDFLASAHALEQSAVSTHTALLSEYDSADAVRITASILTVEARHATVIADVLGVDDLDVIFGNEQDPLDLASATS
jgi:hypothetical protein